MTFFYDVHHLICNIETWQSLNVAWTWLSDCFSRLSPNLCCLFQALSIEMCFTAEYLQCKYDFLFGWDSRTEDEDAYELGEGRVQLTLFCSFYHCYFISSPNNLKICHTIKQLYIHNIMPNHECNTLHKKFYNQFKKGTFLSSVAHALDMSMGCTWPVNKKLGCIHCIMFTWYPLNTRHLLTAFPLLSHYNYPLSLHGKTDCMITKHSVKPIQYAEIHALPYKYNVPLRT